VPRRVAVDGLEEREQRRVVRVDSGHDAEVVLVLVEVVGRGGDGVVERVGKRGVEGPEVQLVDLVGEVEGCVADALSFCVHRPTTYPSDPNAPQSDGFGGEGTEIALSA
jgi:hypothetical protein